jgi:N-dimethylarginine dimethylaminohydrolase
VKIALEWDGVIATDPELWTAYVKEALFRGHSVVLVSRRMERPKNPDENKPLEEWAEHLGVEVVYTSGQQKQDIAGADIWIDPRPDTVVGTAQVQHLISSGTVLIKD